MFGSTNAALAYLEDRAKDLLVFNLAKHILENPDFHVCTASGDPKKHHYGECGLLIHTAEVVCTALTLNEIYNYPCTEDVVYLTALYHDIGKLEEYKKNSWDTKPKKKKIYHTVSSYTKFLEIVAPSSRYTQTTIDEIGHAILAHHGRLEFGSPVTPQTPLAWIIHTADNLSAKLYEVPKEI
jgi:3'-5' exoribonuclease